MPTRRQILTGLSALLLGRRLSSAPGPTAFPYAGRLSPLQPGEAKFPVPGYLPSFVHPNGEWVMLSDNTGQRVLWDWRKGVPVQAWGGGGAGDLPSGPCVHEGPEPGAFAGTGRHWVYPWAWAGGDDGWKVCILDAKGEKCELDQELPGALQLDPRRAVLHFLGSPDPIISHHDLDTGKTWRVGAAEPKGLDLWSPNEALSPDGKWLLRFHADGPATRQGWWAVWSGAQGRCLAFRRGMRADRGDGIGFSLSGARAFVPLGEGWKVEPWDWAGRFSVETQPVTFTPRGALGPSEVHSADGHFRLVRQSDSRIEVRERASGRLVRRLVGILPNPRLVAFGPRAHLSVIGESGGVAWLWNRAAPPRAAKIGEISGEPLMRPAFSTLGDGTRSLLWAGGYIGQGDDTGAVRLWQVNQLRMPDGSAGDEAPLAPALWSHRVLAEPIRSLAWGGAWLGALGAGGGVVLLDPRSGATRRAWVADRHRANDLVPCGQRRSIITAGLAGLALWRAEDGALIRRFGQSLGEAIALAIYPGAQTPWVAAGFLGGQVAMFDWSTGNCLWTREAFGDLAASVAFRPDGGLLLAVGWDGTPLRLDPASGRPSELGEALPKVAPAGNLQSLAWAAGGRSLAIGNRFHDFTQGGWAEQATFDWDVECT